MRPSNGLSVWQNITIDITRVRAECTHCHEIAKSNPMQPPEEPPRLDLPFQLICSDYFSHGGNDYVVIVDRYTNWPIAFKAQSGADGLIKHTEPGRQSSP